MSFRRSVAVAFLLFSSSILSGLDVRPYMPTGEVVADVMTLMAAPRTQELLQRFRDAMSKDPEWFKAYVAASPEGEALPYNSRFGLSEAEYSELLASQQKLTLKKTGEARLKFVPKGDSRILIESPDSPDLNGVEIDFAHDKVLTSYGSLDTRSEIDNSDAASPTGAWAGSQWSVERHDDAMTQGVIAKIALGRLAASGRLILYFSAKEMKEAKLTRRTDLVLYFNARAGSA